MDKQDKQIKVIVQQIGNKEKADLLSLPELVEKALKSGKNKETSDTAWMQCSDLRYSKTSNRKDITLNAVHRNLNYTISLPGSYLNLAWSIYCGLESEARRMIAPVIKDRLVINFHADCAGVLAHLESLGLRQLFRDTVEYFQVEQYLQLKYLLIFATWMAKEFPETSVEIFYSVPNAKDPNLFTTHEIADWNQIEYAISVINSRENLQGILQELHHAVDTARDKQRDLIEMELCGSKIFTF